ncbi:MAG TPA: response regulator [Thermosynechococcaceae cyanobacterium]
MYIASEQNQRSKQAALILIVDDNPNNLRVLFTMLRDSGFRVLIATNGQDTLQKLEEVSPDLILLDVMMPDMDGFEVCRRLKQNLQTKEIPVIFMTALSEVQDKVQGLTAGAVDYITKPFQHQEVLARIQLHLDLSFLNQALKEKTERLEQSLLFEGILKQITDAVRDSLNEKQVLQTAVQKLMQGLKAPACEVTLLNYNFETITWEATTNSSHETTLSFSDYVDVLPQLMQRQCFQMCERLPRSRWQDWQSTTALLCPIADGQNVTRIIWLYRQSDEVFSDLEIRLVQQVADQCAIGIRQAQLYQAAEARVIALEMSNQEKDDVLTAASHDLRAPIANIKMVVEFLKLMLNRDKLAGSLNEQLLLKHQSDITRYFQILDYECDRELQLVDDLLELQVLESGVPLSKTEDVFLSEWIDVLVDSFQGQMKSRQLQLQLLMSDRLPSIRSNPDALRRILSELLHNACKYTPPNEQVIIKVFEKDGIELEVTNSGVEIPSDSLCQIFDRFYRVTSIDRWKQGGTGLGLAIVKKLVECLGGTIKVVSAEMRTTFSVSLPFD